MALPSSHDEEPRRAEALPTGQAAWVLDETGELIAIATVAGDLVYANRPARAALGLAAEDPLAGRTLAHLHPGWAWHLVQEEAIPRALAGGSWSGESAVSLPGREEMPVAQKLLVSGAGEERRLVSIMRDLREDKRHALDRLELMNRYEAAIRLSGQVLLDWAPFTGHLICSGDLQGLLGRDPRDLKENFATLRSYVHMDDLPGFDEAVQHATRARLPISLQFRVRQPDGSYREVRAGGGAYLNREGRFGRMAVLLMNAEHLREARDEVARLQAQLELGVDEQVRLARAETDQARQARSEFLSRMSHELRTPLNAILGFTQLLELEDPTPPQKESIEHIARAGQHLLSLINEVLDLSRLESGRLAVKLENVPVHPALQLAIDQTRPLAAHDEITLVLDESSVEPDLCAVADEQRLRQVLHSLLANAVKFNRPGGTVTLRCATGESDRVCIAVSDTGAGMTPEQVERLFTPLIREPVSGQERGTGGVGLSLALARGIVRAMHGELRAESEPGVGSTFWLSLPRADAEEPAAPPPDEEPPAAAAEQPPAGPQLQRTILYIEDEQLNLQLVQRVLADYPEYRLLTLNRGQHAYEFICEHRPDLVLLDLNLPDLSGEAILRLLKADPALATLPVIMVTADVLGQRLEALLEAGAAGYLAKPFRISEFIRMIRDTLAHPDRPPGRVES